MSLQHCSKLSLCFWSKVSPQLVGKEIRSYMHMYHMYTYYIIKEDMYV